MIQEARVGVGIQGNEGTQAARAADYAIPRFHHLSRLLAVHGRYSLIRVGNFVQYSFYKNIMIAMFQMFFGAISLFSGQTIMESWFLTLFNMLFTLFPPFLMGLMEKDLKGSKLMRHPEAYKELRKLNILNWKSFSFWFVKSIYHSLVCFVVLFFVMLESGGLTGGQTIFSLIYSSYENKEFVFLFFFLFFCKNCS